MKLKGDVGKKASHQPETHRADEDLLRNDAKQVRFDDTKNRIQVMGYKTSTYEKIAEQVRMSPYNSAYVKKAQEEVQKRFQMQGEHPDLQKEDGDELLNQQFLSRLK